MQSSAAPARNKPIFACLWLLLSGLMGAAVAQDAPTVTKVEPPSWWSNHSINPVRLLVRGTNLTGTRVRATRPQTIVSDVRINKNGTYLFVNVRITTEAKPGEYPLTVESAGGVERR